MQEIIYNWIGEEMQTQEVNFMLIPRCVAFKNGIAVGGCFYKRTTVDSNVEEKVVLLPTDHYDFAGPVDFIGKTKEQIESDVKQFIDNVCGG